MPFTQQEKSRIKSYLRYPDWQQLAASIQLGFPAGSQPLFLLEDAFNRLTTDGETSVRRDLCQCEAIDAQLADARSRFKATALGELKLRADETDALRKELDYWRGRLADDLGVVLNPYSTGAYEGNPGGLNARVQS